MGKLIDAEVIVNFLEEEKNNWEGQNPYNRGRSDSLQWTIDRIKSNNSRIGIIDSIPSPTIKPGDTKTIKFHCRECDFECVVQYDSEVFVDIDKGHCPHCGNSDAIDLEVSHD